VQNVQGGSSDSDGERCRVPGRRSLAEQRCQKSPAAGLCSDLKLSIDIPRG
jgi:hypothetical protein